MRCGICKFQNKSKLELPCLECTSNRAMDYFKPMTNSDRIRNFSDEELAIHIANSFQTLICEELCGEDLQGECDGECERCSLQWLQAEVKEGDTDE